MKVIFLGVGEACDENAPNTSIWMQSGTEGEERRSILFDCGPTVPPLFFAKSDDANALDGLWISHFHADHFFGIPTLLLRFWEMNRTKTLHILGQTGTEQLVAKTMELAYPRFLSKLAYPMVFHEVEPEQEGFDLFGLSWRFARSGHGQPNLALRLDDGERALFYSGDGSPTAETFSLARECDLVIHEAFDLEDRTPGHATVAKCIELAREAKVNDLALVHLQREVRKNRRREVLQLMQQASDLRVILPEPGHTIDLK